MCEVPEAHSRILACGRSETPVGGEVDGEDDVAVAAKRCERLVGEADDSELCNRDIGQRVRWQNARDVSSS